jgi:protein-S-isoprenylcysteine O-methyltransferase Ste14
MSHVANRRPVSDVSHGVGLIGLLSIFCWYLIVVYFQLNHAFVAYGTLAVCGLPMLLWSVFVDKVHRNPSTGIDWDHPRPLKDVVDISKTKLLGLWSTLALIGAAYSTFRFYWSGHYLFAMEILTLAALPLLLLSIPYVLWLDRFLKDPKDNTWHFGMWITGNDGADLERVYAHLRSWAVKGFFMAFMLSIIPASFATVVYGKFSTFSTNPVAMFTWLTNVMFMIDVTIGSVGYILTIRPLDAHIRSASPSLAGWTAALLCYPPFHFMDSGSILDYSTNGIKWSTWLAGYPTLVLAIGAVLVLLTAVYAWSTVAFGIRFSNLTYRGVVTHGPYAWSKHPAYLAKNAYWWLAALPFIATTGTDALRNTALLMIVSGIYYWRAKTEEQHMSCDPKYVAYSAWMAEHGLIARLRRSVAKSNVGATEPSLKTPAISGKSAKTESSPRAGRQLRKTLDLPT